MQNVSFKQKLVSMEDDLSSMTTWCQRYQEDANRQGALDLKYVTDRYNNGVKEAEKIIGARHKVVLQEDYTQAHATVMNYIHAIGAGSPPLLDLISLSLEEVNFKANLVLVTVCR